MNRLTYIFSRGSNFLSILTTDLRHCFGLLASSLRVGVGHDGGVPLPLLPAAPAAGANCIKIGLPENRFSYFQENRASRRPLILLRISFPGRPIFIQFVPAAVRAVRLVADREGDVLLALDALCRRGLWRQLGRQAVEVVAGLALLADHSLHFTNKFD